ncbi:hypothetical protein BMF38_03280 [Comamonas kerstersii]|nr:hypothetical protein BMF38_03280 [Comamonas kerstersii]
MQRHGGMDQGWQAPIPAFPQRGKERKPEGEGEKARGEEVHLSRLYSLPRWGRVGVGAARRGRRSLTPALSRKREREFIPNS